MNWLELERLIEQNQLHSNTRDLEALHTELEEKRNQLHPDKSGGEFTDEAHQELYHRLSQAIEFIELQQKAQSIVITPEQLVRIVTDLTNATEQRSQKHSIPTDEERMHVFSSRIKKRYYYPKLTTGILSSLIMLVIGWMTMVDKKKSFFRLTRTFASSRLEYTRTTMTNYTRQIRRELFSIRDRYFPSTGLREPKRTQQAENQAHNPLLNMDRRSLETEALVLQFDAILAECQSLKSQIERATDLRRVTKAKLRSYLEAVSLGAKNTKAILLQEEKLALEQAHTNINIFLVFILIILVTLFCRTWFIEKSDERWGEFLLTEDGLHTAVRRLHNFLKERRYEGKRRSGKFSSLEFAMLISEKSQPRYVQLISNRSIDSKATAVLGPLLLEKLVEKKVIEPLEEPSISKWYKALPLKYDDRR